MKRMIITAAAAAATLALAACGSSNDNSSTDATPAAAGGGKTVSVKSVDGVGNVLVDSSGMALYASDQETGGKVLCDKGCLSFWKPLKAGAGAPTADPSVGKLSVVKRPDGSMQVAANGKLLYSFAEDSPGKVEGNGFKDDFSGQHFTWHAVLAGGKPASSSKGGEGYGSGGGSSNSSNYGY